MISTAKDCLLFINGKWVEAESGESIAVRNPATGEVIGSVPKATSSEVDLAVEAARAAFKGVWKKTPATKRTLILMKIAELLRERFQEIVHLEVLNTGKAISGVKGEVISAIETFEFFAGATTKVYGQTSQTNMGIFNYTLKEPVGVCAQVIPWNYPFMMAAWKIAPALAAGCTVVLKPASLTPLTALLLGEICHKAGVPDGVVNIITGPGSTVGDYLVAHPGVDKVAFTGETSTGKTIMKQAAETMKRVTMELGGKSPNIVFSDADIEGAVNGSVWGIFTSGGQSCEARSRLFVHEDIYEEFMDLFIKKTQNLRVGDPYDSKVHIGSLISPSQVETVDGYVKIGLAEGATLAYGGKPIKIEELPNGNFYQPTILTDVQNHMRVAQEEIFGPVVVVMKFKDENEVIELANDTIYGLAATIWSRDAARCHRVASQLEAGIVTVNNPFTCFPGTPFGGYKQTGFGREMAMEALNLYTETKSVMFYAGENLVNPFRI